MYNNDTILHDKKYDSIPINYEYYYAYDLNNNEE